MKEKRRLRKGVLSFSLAVIMIIGTLTGIVPGTSIKVKAATQNGVWSNGINYSYDTATGVLTLTSNGSTTVNKSTVVINISDPISYTINEPFSNISRIVISEGITSIGDMAFANWNIRNNLTIEIPSTVTSIGDWAFSSITNGSVSVIMNARPNDITTFYRNAFCDSKNGEFITPYASEWKASDKCSYDSTNNRITFHDNNHYKGIFTLSGVTYTVTYRVINGTWDGSSKADKTESVESGASPKSVPAGMKADSGYTGGSWDKNPSEATITKNTTFTYTFDAKTAATVTKEPEAKTLTYNGEAQDLVTAGEATGGEMQYALGTEDAVEEYTASIPTATKAGTYYVWYKVKGDANHTDSKADSVPVTIGKKEITRTVTFKVVNGSWDNGDTKAITVTKSGYEGDTFKLDEKDIPKVGTKPNSGFKAGKWDVTPSTSTVLKGGEVYTYTYAKEDAVSVTVTFKVVNGSWDNGDTKTITVTKSGYEGDTFKLDEKDIPKVGTKPNSGFKAGKWDVTPSTSTVLKGGEVYTYTYAKKDAISVTVTFKVVNGKWNNKTTKTKSVTLKGVEGQVLKLTKDQIPAVGSIPNSGYKKGSWNKTPDTATEIKNNTTYIYTYAKATAAATVTKAPTAMKLTYNGNSQALVKAGTAKNGTMYYAVTTSKTAPRTGAYKTSIPEGKKVGTYYVWYKAKGKTGYKDSGVKRVKVTIAKKTAAIYGFNTSFKCTQTKGKAVISWTKQSNVAKVDAYVTYCGTKYPTTPITTEKNAVTITKINGKKLDQTKDCKIYLVGYDSSGKKVGNTITAHFVGKDNKNYTNVKSFTLNKSEVTIKKGRSTTLRKATIKLEDSKKKQISDSHAAELRFKTTNPKIAKVDKNGKITGVAAGSCTVYAYARNGLSRKVKVTVTK